MISSTFDSQFYGPVFGQLLAEERLMDLGPGRPDPRVYDTLNSLQIETAFAPRVVKDSNYAALCIAGLWLYYDYLEQSHRISQKITGPSGSYWHAIMHRREPDSGNSKYWLDRTGRHPIFPDLNRQVQRLLADQELPGMAGFLGKLPEWDAYGFVDLCELGRKGDAEIEMLCRRIQALEWRLLFDFCFQAATVCHC